MEPPARSDIARTVAGLVEVVRILKDALGYANDTLAKLAIGESLNEDDARALGAEGCDALVATGVTPAGVWR